MLKDIHQNHYSNSLDCSLNIIKRLICTCVKLAKTSVDSGICLSFSIKDYHWQGKYNNHTYKMQ